MNKIHIKRIYYHFEISRKIAIIMFMLLLHCHHSIPTSSVTMNNLHCHPCHRRTIFICWWQWRDHFNRLLQWLDYLSKSSSFIYLLFSPPFTLTIIASNMIMFSCNNLFFFKFHIALEDSLVAYHKRSEELDSCTWIGPTQMWKLDFFS